ncbi:GNAT family N-acetyltransferase [Priestia sp. BR_2]
MEGIRILLPEDAETFRDIRLEGLLNSPESFGITHEEYQSRDIEVIRSGLNRTSDSFTLGTFDSENQMIGLVGFKQEQAIKFKHKGFIWGMYVNKPRYRSQGVGKRLIIKVIEIAKQNKGLEQINLCVVVGNQNAKRLYESIGFKVYGIERRALKHNGIDYDEELMTLWL